MPDNTSGSPTELNRRFPSAYVVPTTTQNAQALVAPTFPTVYADGVNDDQPGLNTLANTTVPATGGTIHFSEGTYLLGSSLTIPSNVRVVVTRGATFTASTSVTLTINGPFECGLFQAFGSNVTVRFGSGAINRCRPEWWGRTNTAAVRLAVEATLPGTAIEIQGAWDFDGIDFLVATGGRDQNKQLIGVGGIAQRGSTLTGASLKLVANANRDAITIIGDDTTCGFSIDNILLDGNKNNQNGAGPYRGIVITTAVEVNLGPTRLIVQNCKGNGVEATATGSPNQLKLGWVTSNGNTGIGIELAGAADSYFDTLVAGNNTGVGVNATGSYIQGKSIRAYSNQVGLMVAGSDGFKCNSVHVNNNKSNGCQMDGNRAWIGHLHTEANGQDSGLIAGQRCGLLWSASGSYNIVEVVHALDTQGTVTQQYHVRQTSTGAGNRVNALNWNGAAGTKNVQFNTTANRVGWVSSSANRQAPAYAASLTIDPYAGQFVDVGTLTGNISFSNINSDQVYDGMPLFVAVTQDGSGGKTVSWGTNFAVTTAVTSTADATTIWRLVGYNGKLYEK